MPDTHLLPGSSTQDPQFATVRLPKGEPSATIRDTLMFPDAIELVSECAPICDGGRYQLRGEIGRGGMGAVYRGIDRELDRELAVKVLHESLLNDPDQVRRFHKEAWVVGQLQHPGIVPLYDAGRLPSGRPYFVMKLVEGKTLASLFAARNGLADDRPRFLKIFEQVCQTIAYAHSRGVIHRDLKPPNIMVGAFGEVQVMDWGLARVLAHAEPELGTCASATCGTLRSSPLAESTLCGDVIGTPAYMAPEQANGAALLDERTDVFGLGAILCELLTGSPPNPANDITEALGQAVRGLDGDGRRRLEDCGADAELVALTISSLDPNPLRRPADAGEMGRRLGTYLVNVEERVRQAQLERASAEARALGERKRRRLAVALGVSVMLVVGIASAGGIAVSHLRSRRTEERTETAQRRVSRHVEAIRRIDAALDEAERLRLDSRQQFDPLPALTRALATARQARLLLPEDLDVPEPTQRLDRAVELLERSEQAARLEASDRRMIAKLDEARARQTEVKDNRFDMNSADPVYAAAFKDYGIDVTKGDPKVVGRQIALRRIRSELSVALLNWAIVRRNGWGLQDRLFAQLLRTAQAADPEPWNLAFRGALLKGDFAAVRKLAVGVRPERTPAEILDLLIGELAAAPDANGAIALAQRALRRYPSDFWLNHHCGFLLLDAKRPEDAIRYLTAAVAVRPQSPGARVNLGYALQRTGRTLEAVEESREAVRLQPDYTDAYNNIGLNLMKLRRPAEALAPFRRAIELKPTHMVARENLVEALIELGRFDEALDLCRDTLRIEPNNVSILIDVARAHEGKNQLADAEAAARRAAQLHPKFAGAHYILGNVLCTLKRHDEAIDCYRASLALSPEHAESHCNLAAALTKSGRYAEAHAAMTRGHELGSRDRTWRYPSGEWIKESAALVEQDRRFHEVRAGRVQLVDARDASSLAKFADRYKRDPAAALDFAELAFQFNPALETGPGNGTRADAIHAAAQVLANDKIPLAVRKHWRRRALTWLRVELKIWQAGGEGSAGATLRRDMDYLLTHPEWRSLIDGPDVAHLATRERAVWEQYWRDARSLYERLPR